MFIPDNPSEQLKPYSIIADLYDIMMRDVEYTQWADYYEKIFQSNMAPVFRIHDIACGTGTLLIELFQRGYMISGSDKSPEMIQQASKKCERLGIAIPLTVANMKVFTANEPLDAVLCMFDSINYLENESEWIGLLNHVYSLLRQGSLFIFDVSTETNSKKNFDRTLEIDRLNRYRRISWYDNHTRIQYNRIEVHQEGRVFQEEHRQYIYDLEEIKAFISQTPFILVGSYDHLSFRCGEENSERVHFVLKK